MRHEAAEAGGGPEFGQGSAAVGDPKKRLELVARKAAIGQIEQDYAFSERRACGLMMLAVTTYRYRSQRSDEPLRTRLVELAPGAPPLTSFVKGGIPPSCPSGAFVAWSCEDRCIKGS